MACRLLARKCQAQGSDLVRRCSLRKPARGKGWWLLCRELRPSVGEHAEGGRWRPTAISVKGRKRTSTDCGEKIRLLNQVS